MSRIADMFVFMNKMGVQHQSTDDVTANTNCL